MLKKIKIAIPTRGDKGLEDVVSEVFGRAETFTIIEVSDDSIDRVEVVKNQAVSYDYGAGPIAVKMLVDMGVTAVAAGELGIGASTLLEQNNIEKVKVEADIPAKKALEIVMTSLSS